MAIGSFVVLAGVAMTGRHFTGMTAQTYFTCRLRLGAHFRFATPRRRFVVKSVEHECGHEMGSPCSQPSMVVLAAQAEPAGNGDAWPVPMT